MRYIRIAAALLIALCLSACGKNEDAWESDGYFMPCTNGAYLLVSNEIGEVEMNPENNDNSVFDGLTVGDKIKRQNRACGRMTRAAGNFGWRNRHELL